MTRTKSCLALLFAALVLATTAAQSIAAPAPVAPLPSRIVLGGKAVVMVADAAFLFPEARDRVVAVAKADQGLGDFLAIVDAGFPKKASIDRAAGAEVYASLAPDLILMKSAMKKSLGSSLDALGLAQAYLELETPEDYLKELLVLGEVFGNKKRAEDLTSYYRGILDLVASRLPPETPTRPRPRVLVLQAQAAEGGSFEVPPASWMQTILVERAGGLPVWKGANPGSGWARVGPEQIAAWNPDLILLISYRENASSLANAFVADPRFSGLAAATAGRVHAFPQDYYSWDQPDVRWGLGLLWAAKKINSTAFADISLLTEARRFFAFGYGIDGARFDETIRQRLPAELGER